MTVKPNKIPTWLWKKKGQLNDYFGEIVSTIFIEDKKNENRFMSFEHAEIRVEVASIKQIGKNNDERKNGWTKG